jgi:hypothetical protein
MYRWRTPACPARRQDGALCSQESSFGTNFAATLRTPKSSVKIVCAEPSLIPMSLAISRTVFHDQTPHFVNDIRISACWRPTGTLVTVNWSSAIFKLVIPFFNLCNPHSVVAESLLNLTTPRGSRPHSLRTTRLERYRYIRMHGRSLYREFHTHHIPSNGTACAEVNIEIHTSLQCKISHPNSENNKIGKWRN